ncbi:hypothetical protein GCM10027294_52900 [Marinactinospora endophytica]
MAEALTQAARHGQGWAPEQIRIALHAAALRGKPSWQALDALAKRTEVGELGELAASLQLAGTEGARVRASLTARSGHYTPQSWPRPAPPLRPSA